MQPEIKQQVLVQSQGEAVANIRERRLKDRQYLQEYRVYRGKMVKQRIRRFDPLFSKKNIDGSKPYVFTSFSEDCIPKNAVPQDMYTFEGFSNTDFVQTDTSARTVPIASILQGVAEPRNVGWHTFETGDPVYIRVPHPEMRRHVNYKHPPGRSEDDIFPIFSNGRLSAQSLRDMLATNDPLVSTLTQLFLTTNPESLIESAKHVNKLQEAMLTEEQTVDDAYQLRVAKMAQDSTLEAHLSKLANWAEAAARTLQTMRGTRVGTCVTYSKPGDRLKLYTS